MAVCSVTHLSSLPHPSYHYPSGSEEPPKNRARDSPLPHSVPSAAPGRLSSPSDFGLDSVVHPELPHSRAPAQNQALPITGMLPVPQALAMGGQPQRPLGRRKGALGRGWGQTLVQDQGEATG